MASPKNDYTWCTINIGSALALAGMGGLYTLDNGTYLQHKMFGFEVVYGIGLGMAMSSSTILIKLHARVEDAGLFDPSTVVLSPGFSLCT